MNQPAKSREPSMEEILASIRRIIADDDKVPSAAASELSAAPNAAATPAHLATPSPGAGVPPSPADFLRDMPPGSAMAGGESDAGEADILELTEDMRLLEAGSPRSDAAMQRSDVVFADDQDDNDIVFDTGADPVEPSASSPVPHAVMPETPHVSSDPLEQARQTLAAQMEAETPLLSRSASAAVDTAFASLAHTVLSQNARTLDDLVKDMLRPMLKSWLDDNLPSLVERLVRAEIERVSRGR